MRHSSLNTWGFHMVETLPDLRHIFIRRRPLIAIHSPMLFEVITGPSWYKDAEV